MWRFRQWLIKIVEVWRIWQESVKAKRVKRIWDHRLEKLPRGKDGRVMLHIGCGDINAQGFINLDARPQSHVHIVTDNLFHLTMVPDAAFDFVYMSHVLEHVSHRDLVSTLREMNRILKQGGVLRVSVPDFDDIIYMYQISSNDIAAIEQPLMGGQDYPFNYHYCVFNEAHLRKMMLKGGFQETRAWDASECEDHDFEDWASKKIMIGNQACKISLNMEAVK